MGFYATDTLEATPPRRASARRARRDPACGRKPLRGPTHKAISGYRFYNPELGRWLNRDPIGENGGMNLVAFSLNNAINNNDRLGLNAWGGIIRVCTSPIFDLFGPNVPEAGGAGTYSITEITGCTLHHERDSCQCLDPDNSWGWGMYTCVYNCTQVRKWYNEGNYICTEDAGETSLSLDLGCRPKPANGCPSTYMPPASP